MLENVKTVELRVSPQDLRGADFKRVLKGYDPVQVDDLLHRAAAEIEALLLEREDVVRKAAKQAEEESSRAAQEKAELAEQVKALESLLQSHEKALAEKDKEIASLKERAPCPGESELKAEVERLREELAAKEAELDDLALSLQAGSPAETAHASFAEEMALALSHVEKVLARARETLGAEASGVLEAAKGEAEDLLRSARAEADAIRAEALMARRQAEEKLREYTGMLSRHMEQLSVFTRPAGG